MADITKFVQDVRELDLHCCNLIVTQHGQVTAKHDWLPDASRDVHSVTKSILALAVGFAVEEGLLSTDEYIVDCFPDELPEQMNEMLKKMKVEHLLTMTLGFDAQYLMGRQRPELYKTEPNWVRYSLSRPLVHEPGSTFLYTGIGPYLASVLVSRRTGMGTVDYLYERLFRPLGIARPEKADLCPMGYFVGMGAMSLTCEELSRIGQMILDDGVYDGRRIIGRDWIERMSTVFAYQDVPDTSLLSAAELAAHTHQVQAEDDEELGNRYGYFFWIIEDKKLFLARGRYGQFCVIDREHDAVITVTSEEHRDPHMVMRLIRRDIIPTL